MTLTELVKCRRNAYAMDFDAKTRGDNVGGGHKHKGDWSTQAWAGLPMVRDKKGTWSLTTKALPPGLYGYSFLVDGVHCDACR